MINKKLAWVPAYTAKDERRYTTRLIVLVEPDEGCARFIKDVFNAKEGFIVLHAETGSDAMEFMEYTSGKDKWTPALIWMEYHLPDMEGRDLLDAIRQDRDWGHAPVVVFSNLDEEELKETHAHFASTVVLKNNTPAGLKEQVSEVANIFLEEFKES